MSRKQYSLSKINKGSEFYDKFGMLKDDYSYKQGKGTTILGSGKVNRRSGAGRDGTTWSLVDRNIYGVAKPKPKKVEPKKVEAAPAKVDTVEKAYVKQIKDLEKRVKQIQASPPKKNVPPPKPPTIPYSVNSEPVSLSNPYKTKKIGGIGQFQSAPLQSGLATIRSQLINI